MLSTLLVEHRWITPALLVLYVVAGLALGPRLVRWRRLTGVLAGLSLLPLAALTLVPVDRDLVIGCAVDWSWPTPARVESFANLVLFVAPVFLAGVAARRPLLAALAGAALSAGIEAFQALVPALGRSCDTGDWAANSLGAAVGGLLAWAVLRLARDRPAAR